LRGASLEAKAQAVGGIRKRLVIWSLPPLWGKDRMGGGVSLRRAALEERFTCGLTLRTFDPLGLLCRSLVRRLEDAGGSVNFPFLRMADQYENN